MNLRALMYFDELVRSSSMREVAEKFQVAPTAVTRQIENLEEYFGAPLVERSSRGVTLTPAGELLALRAGKTLREFAHVHRLIDDLKGLGSGCVNIYANGATVAHLLTPVLAQFSIEYPKLKFRVHITSASQAIDALSEGKADIAISLFAPRLPDFQVRSRLDVTYDLICAAEHPIAESRMISLQELAGLQLALPDISFAARQAIDAKFASIDLVIDPVFETSSVEMLTELVRRNAAVTLLPKISVQRGLTEGYLKNVPIQPDQSIKTQIDVCIAPERPLSYGAERLLISIDEFINKASQ